MKVEREFSSEKGQLNRIGRLSQGYVVDIVVGCMPKTA
jgi:hypothetical protein